MIKKLFLCLLLMVLSYFVIINIAIHQYGKSIPTPNAEVMIILGAQVKGDPAYPGRTLQERLDAALPYLKQNLSTKVIVCGGQGKDESATEAKVMFDYLVAKGIDSERIYQEDQSTRTAHQFIYAKKILPFDKAVVVTSDFHILRSLMLAKRSGLSNVSALPSITASDNRDKRISFWREPLALINSYLFDHPQAN